jgi:hypothetical protein
LTGPYPPPPAATPANDRTTLWGVLGIIFAFCCTPLAILFAVLSLLEARKYGKPPTLAYVAFAVIAVGFIIGLILAFAGALPGMRGY